MDWYLYPKSGKWILEFDKAKMSADTFALALEQARKNAIHDWKKKGEPGTVRVHDTGTGKWRIVSRYGY